MSAIPFPQNTGTAQPYVGRSSGRHLALAAIVLAHLLLIWLWPAGRLPPLAAAQRILLLQFVASPPPPTARPLPKPVLVRPLPPPPAAAAAPPVAAALSATAPVPAPVEPPREAPTGETLTENALRDIGKIDRALQKGERKLYSSEKPAAFQDKFARAISSAAPLANGSMAQHTFPDGRRMVRFKTPGGYACYTFEGPGAVDGIDHNMQNGAQQKMKGPMTCGHYFDGVP